MGVELMVLGAVQAAQGVHQYMETKEMAKEAEQLAGDQYKAAGKGSAEQGADLSQEAKSEKQVKKAYGNETPLFRSDAQNIALDVSRTQTGAKSDFLNTKARIDDTVNQAGVNMVGSLISAGTLMTQGLSAGPRGPNNKVQYDPRYGGLGYLFGFWDR